MKPSTRAFVEKVKQTTEDDRLVNLKSMRDWTKLGATRRTREKIAQKLRGK